MIKITVYQITPYLTEGSVLQDDDRNNRTNWLRVAINMMMNRRKAELVKEGVDIDLFHNHDPLSGKNKQEYPKIQYLRKQNNYYVTGINEGEYALEKLFADCKQVVFIHENLTIKIDQVSKTSHGVELSGAAHTYLLTNWLPFSDNSDKEYSTIESLAEKILFLEKRLTNHIVNDFCRYLKIPVGSGEVKVSITKVDDYGCKKVVTVENRNVKYYQPFTIMFQTNLPLPEKICLGNRKAYGFGLVEAV